MSSSESAAPESWISSFCSLLGHEYFAEVSEDFIEDDFNLTGLQSQVPMYKEALEMILDVEPEEEDDEEEEEEEEEDDDDDEVMHDENGNRLDGYRPQRRHTRMASDLSVIESSAELLYGLIHQRYITSRPGIQQMAEKYDAVHFGHCPRVFCNSTKVLPVGCHDTPGIDTVKLFCPSCLDVYIPPNSRFGSVDGAFFGTTFGSLFLMTFPEIEVAAKGDPLNLVAINPIFAPFPLNPPTNTALGRRESRSSSLTSNNAVGGPSNPLAPTPQIPAEWLPPLNQPTSINGISPSNLAPGLGPGKIHEPKIYGFRVSERAKTGPRMKWLRSRPVDVTELDEVSRYAEENEEMEVEEDEDEEGEGEAQGTETQQQNGGAAGGPGTMVGERRKKALPRRRRGVGGDGGGGRGHSVQMNGVGDAL
ncbi:MAG: hypothetical protein LQ340_005371 [Diploschistes diacapsis]|nr:MAG: hypothetical protein LQ340_005371 [Diploschistes diacapsis]